MALPFVKFRHHEQNEKTSLMQYRNWKLSDSIEMAIKKETFTIVDPVPDDARTRSFSLDPEFSTRKGCFVIKKLHIICVLAVVLTIGIILTLHRKHTENKGNFNLQKIESPSEQHEQHAYTYAWSEIETLKTPGSPNEKTKISHPLSINQKYSALSAQSVTDNNGPISELYLPNSVTQDDQTPHQNGLPNALKSVNHTLWDPKLDNEKLDISKLEHLIHPMAYKIYIQLPSDVNAYDLYSQQSYSGNVSIILRSKEDIKYIIIGASDLRIVSVSLISLDDSEYGRRYDISIDQYDVDEGTLVFHVSQPVRANFKYNLQIQYNGDIQQMPYGLFRIKSNITETGEIKTLVATNTDVPFTRAIFPCFDLPTQTAKYELHVCRGLSMITETSSSYVTSERDSSNTCTWENFQSTNEIPLHFFGFVISDYTFQRTVMSKYRTFTVWTPYKTVDEISYALEVGPRLVEILENYFDIDLPISNIDVYPVPAVFPYLSARLGLIITQESDICIKESVTSEAEKEHVVKNLSAHLIEQFVGFINFEDEEDNWLKESLVQYLQYVVTDLGEPKWKIMQHFFADVHLTEMDTDIINTHKKPLHLKYSSQFDPRTYKPNKHALMFPIKKTNVFSTHTDYSTIVHSNTDDVQIIPEIYSEIFDRKDMDKGICIVRMVHHVVTERAFQRSLKQFIEISKHGSVTGNQFWDLLSTEAGPDLVPEDMSLRSAVYEWIYNREYPIVQVTRDYTKNTVLFEQFVDVENNASKNHRYFRYLPVSYTTQEVKQFSSTAPKFWMKQMKKTLKDDISELKPDQWILVNPKQTNLYRVNYDEPNWTMLQNSCLKGEFPAEIRAQLIDDALFLARRGLLKYEFAMEFTARLLSLETEYVVWTSALHHFDYMRSIINIDDDEKYASQRVLFQEFLKDIIVPMYTNINFHGLITKKYRALDQLSPAEHNQLLVESEIFRWACDVNVEKCSTKAVIDFKNWKRQDDPSRIPINPNLRYGTLCNAMKIADQSDFDFLYQVYLNTSPMNPNKFIYLKSLYCYKNITQMIPKILSITLQNDYSVSHLHEVSNIWQALIENPIPSTAPFDYLLMYWRSILKTFKDFIPIMRNIIEGATINIHNERQFTELTSLKEGVRNVDKYNEVYEILYVSTRHVENRIEWKNHEMPKFLAWLEKTKS